MKGLREGKKGESWEEREKHEEVKVLLELTTTNCLNGTIQQDSQLLYLVS